MIPIPQQNHGRPKVNSHTVRHQLVKTPPKRVEPRPAFPGQLVLIADELEKLDALRQKGILTHEEFDREKAKLFVRIPVIGHCKFPS